MALVFFGLLSIGVNIYSPSKTKQMGTTDIKPEISDVAILATFSFSKILFSNGVNEIKSINFFICLNF